MAHPTMEQAAGTLRRFADQACRGESPLYEHLCSQTADDQRLLGIVLAAPAGQPMPNLFLGAIHYLLLAGAEHELAAFYPSCVAAPKPHQHAFPAFREFCLAHEAAIRDLVAHRRVQTNEVCRCAYLLPAFMHVARTTGDRPLVLIDIGTSGGLNLIWDRYAYDFGPGKFWGNPAAPVRITTELRGHLVPRLTDQPPVVAHRIGVDLHIPDLTSTTEALWLKALIWPDQPERMQRLTAAIPEWRRSPPDLLGGNALDVLPDLIRTASRAATVCIVHCHTLNQFSVEQREAFHNLLAAAGRDRPVVELSAEWIGTATPELWLLDWTGGVAQDEHLANVDQHGRWIQWLVAAD